MVKGIGIDLCSISRIRKILDREGPEGPFFLRTFTEAERCEAERIRNKAPFYAARFAAKEAAYKAIAPLTAKGFDLRIVESLHREDGSPHISLSDALLPVLSEAGIEKIFLSVTTEGDFAQAMVLVE